MANDKVPAFVAALDNYSSVRKEQNMAFATRKPRDLDEADAHVRSALRELIADL